MIAFNGLTLDDNLAYLVEEVTYRSMPKRVTDSAKISYRSGEKRLRSEWDSKQIQIKGRVFSTTVSGVQALVDTLQQNFATEDGSLVIDLGRSYTATLDSLDIPTQFFNASMVQYTANFIAYDPFAYASPVSISGTVASGVGVMSVPVVVSGTVYAEPLLSVYPTGANAGDSGINQLTATYSGTGEAVTLSGTINYASQLAFDYHAFLTTSSGVSTLYSGIFARWQPGSQAFSLTVVSGIKQGFNYTLTYSPRYYE